MSSPTRIAFAGTPEFAVPALQALVASGFEVPVVFTQPDRPAGRGRKLNASPVKRAAEALELRVDQPTRLDDPRLLDRYAVRPELLVVAAYGLLLPQWLLDWPRVACLNLHASLLPRWRGAAPIQHAILAGDAKSGVSLMHMVAGLDRGPVYAGRALAIGAEETAGELHERLAALAAELLVEELPRLLDGTLEPVAQNDAEATHAPKIGKAEAPLDWTRPAAELARRVRAFNPWPVAEARLDDGRRLRIWRAAAQPGPAGGRPGTILAAGAAGIDVATGQDRLRLLVVQPPGAKAMPVGAYLAAHSLERAAFAL